MKQPDKQPSDQTEGASEFRCEPLRLQIDGKLGAFYLASSPVCLSVCHWNFHILLPFSFFLFNPTFSLTFSSSSAFNDCSSSEFRLKNLSFEPLF